MTLAGKRIAAVGDSGFDALASQPVALGDTRWAFVARTGDAVVIQDVATGAITQTIATGAAVDAGFVGFAGDGQWPPRRRVRRHRPARRQHHDDRRAERHNGVVRRARSVRRSSPREITPRPIASCA